MLLGSLGSANTKFTKPVKSTSTENPSHSPV